MVDGGIVGSNPSVRSPRFRRHAEAVLLTLILAAITPQAVRASDILTQGFDLFDPITGTRVNLPLAGIVPFVGVPLETVDFGFGPVPTFNADTVIERLEDANGPMDVVPIVLRAMQLVSVAPVDLGSGLDFHFLTLQALTPSTGTMIFVDFGGPHIPPPAHGSVRYDPINWLFDVRKGSLGGPIVFSGSKVLTTANTPWTHFPPPGAVLIPGVNVLLDGTQFSDFFPESFSLTSEDGTEIVMRPATVPEPTMMVLTGIGVAVSVARKRRARSRGRRK